MYPSCRCFIDLLFDPPPPMPIDFISVLLGLVFTVLILLLLVWLLHPSSREDDLQYGVASKHQEELMEELLSEIKKLRREIEELRRELEE